MLRCGAPQGETLGVVHDVAIIAKGDDELIVFGRDATTLLEHIARAQPHASGRVPFSLVAELVEYRDCRFVSYMRGSVRLKYRSKLRL